MPSAPERRVPGRAFLYNPDTERGKFVKVWVTDHAEFGKTRVEPMTEEGKAAMREHLAAGRSIHVTTEMNPEDKAAFVEGLHDELSRQGGLLGHLVDEKRRTADEVRRDLEAKWSEEETS